MRGGGFGKYLLIEDVFVRRNDRLRVSCDSRMSGRVLVTGSVTRMDVVGPP